MNNEIEKFIKAYKNIFKKSVVALCGWAAKADDSFVCFGAKPDKGFLDMKSRRIRKWEGDANESWLEKELRAVGAGQQRGSWRGTRTRAVGAEQQRGSWRGTRTRAVSVWTAESWRGTMDRGSQHRTRETVAEKIGSSDSESRWVWFQ